MDNDVTGCDPMRSYATLAILVIAITSVMLALRLTPQSAHQERALTASIETPMNQSACKEKIVLRIFHAGSLTVPFEEMRKAYERENPCVEIRLEASGSVEAIRKVTELDKRADVIASADHHLIPALMFPSHADWYIVFATNELVIAYTNRSKYSDEIDSSNWYEVLMREGVRFGFSDPNKDPCGYRTVMALLLANKLYNSSLTFFLTKETNLRIEGTEAWVPEPFVGSDRVIIRPKEVELLSLLESGVLDYAFEYKSVAIQHRMRYVELPPEVNLASLDLVSLYSQTVVHLFAGKEDERVVRGDSIAYAVTIPKVSENRDAAISFMKFLLTKGLDVLEERGQSPLRPPVGFGNIPAELRGLVRVKQ